MQVIQQFEGQIARIKLTISYNLNIVLAKNFSKHAVEGKRKTFHFWLINEVAAIPYNKFCTPCELIKCNRILAGADVLNRILVANL